MSVQSKLCQTVKFYLKVRIHHVLKMSNIETSRHPEKEKQENIQTFLSMKKKGCVFTFLGLIMIIMYNVALEMESADLELSNKY